MTREEIKKMMAETENQLVSENDYTLEYLSPEHITIVFEFDEKGLLYVITKENDEEFINDVAMMIKDFIKRG